LDEGHGQWAELVAGRWTMGRRSNRLSPALAPQPLQVPRRDLGFSAALAAMDAEAPRVRDKTRSISEHRFVQFDILVWAEPRCNGVGLDGGCWLWRKGDVS